MKKVFAVVLVVALTVCLAVTSFATVNIDLINETGPDGAKVAQQDTWTIQEGGTVEILGWAYEPNGEPLQKMFYTVDGTEKACQDNYRDRADLVAAFGDVVPEGGRHAGFGKDPAGERMYLEGIENLKAGEYTIEIYALYEDGEEELGKTFTLIVEGEGGSVAPAGPTFANVAILDNGGGAIGTWVNAKNDSAFVEFTTAGSFKGVNLGVYWASNPVVGNGPKAEWKCELFKFQYNPEYTMSQAPIKTKTVTSDGDNNPAFAFDFGEEIPAGTYILKFTITNPDYEEMLKSDQDDEAKMKKPYLVLPKIDNPAENKFRYGNDPFNLVFNAENVEGDFFLANPTDVDAPAPGDTPAQEPNAKTGDASIAMIAVIAVLAMGAAVVFMKKKSY